MHTEKKYCSISVDANASVAFHNNTAFCIGTGRMGLALHQEYQEQMKMVQSLCHFKHIRGHGLFHDDMSIYNVFRDAQGNERVSYNFTYLDRVMDGYLDNGLEPFIELGFMPEQLASDEQTLFYWKAHTVPPRDEGAWCALVQATLRHLMERYGVERVVNWPVEVWNEPNLPGFWKDADKLAYLRLYEITVKAVKEVDSRFRVGGPAICGGSGSQEWVRDFLAFCHDSDLPVDFVTRHAYMGQQPEHKGRYLYHAMCAVDITVREMQTTRDVIDSFPEFKGIPMHITEFNTSYNPFCPIHDTVLNAAIMAEFLAKMGDVASSYSYWTFGDVFEEQGVPATPFHGGFGLMANGLIAKPTLWTFAWFANLKGNCVYRDDNLILLRRADGSYEGVAWNASRDAWQTLDMELALPSESGRYVVLSEQVSEGAGDPLKMWHEMGEPACLTPAQLARLRGAAHPICSSESLRVEGDTAHVKLSLKEREVLHFTVEKAPLTSEYGYEYEWYETNLANE